MHMYVSSPDLMLSKLVCIVSGNETVCVLLFMSYMYMYVCITSIVYLWLHDKT